MREIESAIDQLDVRRQQVLIEAAIIEVEGTDADQLCNGPWVISAAELV